MRVNSNIRHPAKIATGLLKKILLLVTELDLVSAQTLHSVHDTHTVINIVSTTRSQQF